MNFPNPSWGDSPIMTIDQVPVPTSFAPRRSTGRSGGAERVVVISARADLLRMELKQLYAKLRREARPRGDW